MRRFLLAVLVIASPVQADPLADLRGTLTRLQAVTPLRGSAEYALHIRTKDGGDLRTEQGHIGLRWEYGKEGLSLKIAPQLLEQAEAEQRARRMDPEKKTPTRNALLSFSTLQVAEALNFATTLLRELERAELLDSRPDRYRGVPTTLLIFKLPPRLSRPEQKHVRDTQIRLSIWRGADGIPVAAERTIRIKARFFIIGIENNRTDRWTLAHRADRLIATRHEEEETTAGLTRSVFLRTITTLTVE